MAGLRFLGCLRDHGDAAIVGRAWPVDLAGHGLAEIDRAPVVDFQSMTVDVVCPSGGGGDW